MATSTVPQVRPKSARIARRNAKIKKLVKERGYTQEEAAVACDTWQPVVSLVLRNRRSHVMPGK